jgi:DNA repair protein RAD57
MTDLQQVLPNFDLKQFSHLLPKLDHALITTSDILSLDPADVAKRAQLPAGELRKLTQAVVAALHAQLGCDGAGSAFSSGLSCISTLDEGLDAALGGGIPAGYLVEVTGESGAGKTQFLLTLLLAAQLPLPHGVAKSAIYISTEAALSTTRLAQLLSSHPALASLPPAEQPSLSRILSIQTPDLESQDHILRYQLPVAIEKHNVGLVILDSVAANFRAEFEKKGPNGGAASMAKRGTQLVQLGALLRDLACTENIAIVVANQVADRFTRAPSAASSNAVSRTTSTNSQGNVRDLTPQPIPSQPDLELLLSPDPLALDHQQKWFTGWGDQQYEPEHAQKTPSLGLVWTNQIACRIALIKQPVIASRQPLQTVNGEEQWNEEESHISKWRRWLKVVFAPWAPPSEGRGVEFEITRSGLRCVAEKT